MVISLDGSSNTCVVRFSGYGNEEEKNLDDLLPPSKRDLKSPRQSGHHCAQLASPEQNVIVLSLLMVHSALHFLVQYNSRCYCLLEW